MNIRPALQLNFASTKRLDPRITFARAGTATYFDATGVMRTAALNEPRFDHDPVTGESLGLLVEEARTNLVYKSQFDSFSGSLVNNVWIEALAELGTTVNATTAPDGTITAALLTVNTNTSFRGISQRSGVATGTTHTFSVFAKPASTDSGISLLISGDSAVTNYGRIGFALTNSGTVGAAANVGTVTATSGKITALSNGWYRVAITVTLASPTNITCYIYPGDRSAQTTNSQTYVWGAQLEAGAFQTSYIPTTSAATTRTADSASMTDVNFSSWFNAAEGTIIAEFRSGGSVTSDQGVAFSISDDTSTEAIQVIWLGSGSRVSADILDGGVSQVGSAFYSPSNSVLRFAPASVAFAYKLNDPAVSHNGDATIIDDASCTLPTVNRLYLAAGYNGATRRLNGTLARLTYYARRLDNTTLQGLSA